MPEIIPEEKARAVCEALGCIYEKSWRSSQGTRWWSGKEKLNEEDINRIYAIIVQRDEAVKQVEVTDKRNAVLGKENTRILNERYSARTELETVKETMAAWTASSNNLAEYAKGSDDLWALPMSGSDITVRDHVRTLRARIAELEKAGQCAK